MRAISLIRPSAIAAAIVVAQLVVVPASSAATAIGSLLVSATVLSTCTVATTPVVFGNYTSVQIDTTGSVTVTCTLDVSSYNVGLGTGAGAGATTSSRMLTSTGNSTLNYSMASNVNHAQNWGNVPGTDTLASTANTSGSGAIKTFTAYARLPAGQSSAAAIYLDTVVVTVNF